MGVRYVVLGLCLSVGIGLVGCDGDGTPNEWDTRTSPCDKGQQLAACDGATCVQVQRERTTRRRFGLELASARDGASPAEVETNWQCLVAELQQHDVELPEDDTMRFVSVEATFEQLEGALHLEGVVGFWVECSDRLCEYCWDLDESECEADAFCHGLAARRLGDMCLEEPAYVGCSAESDCGAAVRYAGPKGGDCYQFPNTCTPQGWEDCSVRVEAVDDGGLPTDAERPDYGESCK